MSGHGTKDANKKAKDGQRHTFIHSWFKQKSEEMEQGVVAGLVVTSNSP